jgi:TonB-linked SusC/RagA family outer membrane protein
MKKTLGFLFLLMWSTILLAQEMKVTGSVTNNADGSPIPGVNVVVKGTTIGTLTDLDGHYSLSVDKGQILQFSLVGMTTVEITVASDVINVKMTDAATDLSEVIVVGYGVQKKSVVTAAIAKVSSDDLKNVAPVRVDNALKGLAAGVTVTTSSGQPGASSKVQVRGIGTINNSDPLYIVDGMPIDGGIDYLNPSDIQSIEVLKDAASGAVYGARAANGVILITTKTGKKGKTSVTYDYSKGWQNPWKEREVLNATEYAIMMNEGAVNTGQSPIYTNPDPYSYGKGTDWQKEVFNYNAPMVNHQLTISGANENVNYYLSAGYFNQEGIVGGDFDRSNYERFTLRSNNTFNLYEEKSRSYLNKVTVGMNVGYTRTTSKGISTNSEYGSPLGSALLLSPILSVLAEDQAATALAHPTGLRNSDGLYYTIVSDEYNEITNPLAQLELPGEKGNSDKFVSNFWGEVNLLNNLKFRSSFGTDLSFWGNDGWTPKYYLGKSNHAENSSVWSSMNRSLVWQVENVLSYDKLFLDKHSVQVVLGQSAKESEGRNIGGSNKYMVEEDADKANIDFTTGTAKGGDKDVYGGATDPHTLSSLFGRLSYNFDERYMLQATIRRDGSSNFGPGNRYAVFPSFSLGWNITNESFMANRPTWFTNTKVRFSWGKNGNESIGSFGYVVLTSTGNNYTFGNGNGIIYNGTKPNGLANPNLKWEESEQTDIGLDLGFLSNSLTFTFDYYIKKTNGMLMTMPVPSYVGESKPTGNVGDMENKGYEFELGYRFKVSDVNFRVNGNATYLKNELIKLGNSNGWANYDNLQNVGTISRAQNGLPFPYFYGYKTNGIFQNTAEVNAYTNADGNLIQPNAKPGDVRFVDIDEDGKISDADRTKIGKGMPDWTYGLNFGADWKGFDFNVMLQGTVGNDIFDATRRTDLAYVNLPAYMLNRWTGEGTSNEIPRFSFSDKNGNWLSSDLYVKDGSYMRVKNMQLGYTLPRLLTQKAFISKLRVYVSAENLLTFTKYEGFDPEISSGGTSLGIDRGIYPQARVFSLGINLGL